MSYEPWTGITGLIVLYGLVVGAPVSAQTTLNLRPIGDSHNCLIVGASNETPIQITCQSPHSLTAGDTIVIGNVPGNTAANGERKVKVSTGPTSFTITDLTGADVAGNGVWTNGDNTTYNLAGTAQVAGKTNAYLMRSGHPYLWTNLDSRSGLEFASKVNNRLLTNIVVVHDVGTANYTRAHCLSAGMNVGVFGSAKEALNATYTITDVTATSITFKTSGVPDGTYDDESLSVSAWAYAGNPPWDALTSSVFVNFFNSFYSGNPANPLSGYGQFGQFEGLAVKCYINERDTNSCTAAKWGLNHFENFVAAGSFALGEANNGGYTVEDSDLDYGVRLGAHIARTYDLLKGIPGMLSSDEVTTFKNKVLNDLADGCVKPKKVNGSGTISISGTRPVTVTGAGTHFITEAPVGSVLGPVITTYNSNVKCLVTAVTSDTSLTCYNGDSVPASGAYSISQGWQAGGCGYIWFAQHDVAMWPGQPVLGSYPNGGGFISVPWSNQLYSHVGSAYALGLALAQDDVRAKFLAEETWEFFVDHIMPSNAAFWNGPLGLSQQYDLGIGYWAVHLWAIEADNAVVNGPSLSALDHMNWMGPWIRYMALPGLAAPSDSGKSFARAYPPVWGGGGTPQSGFDLYSGGPTVESLATFPALNPGSPEAGKWMYWLNNKFPDWTGARIAVSGGVGAGLSFETAWPTILPIDFSSDPTSKWFAPTKKQLGDCQGQGQTSWQVPCSLFKGMQYVVSRTGWDMTSSSRDSLLLMSSDMWETDHSMSRVGETFLWKGDELIGADNLSRQNRTPTDPNAYYSEFQIGTVPTELHLGLTASTYFHGVTAYPRVYNPYFDRYHSDANTHTYAQQQMGPAITADVNVTSATREWAHMKKSGTNEYVFIHTRFALDTGNTIIGDFVHYQQNGETGEGTTTCPGTGGCDAFGTNQEILSLSTISGVHSKYLPMPGNMVYLDTVDGTYPSGKGHSFRVSGCAGASSCNSSAKDYEMVQVHKVFYGTTDPGIMVTALNPDSNWTGAQMEDKVVLFARGGVTQSNVTSFTTTHSGTAQYLFGGLAPGIYAVTINGQAVPGSPFAVADGDNAVEFESTAGTVSVSGGASVPLLTLNPGSLSFSCVSGSPNPSSQTLGISSANVTLDNWSAAKGQSWLNLSPTTGSAAGNITVSVDCARLSVGKQTDAITVSSATAGILNSPQTVTVTLNVSAPQRVPTRRQ